MERLSVGLLAAVMASLTLAFGCDVGAGTKPDVTPDSERTVVLQETVEPTPTPTPATPEPVPTVHLPPVKSLEHLGTNVAVPALPATFAPPKEDAALDALIRTTLAGFEGQYAVVVRNLDDGRRASLNEGQVYKSASLFKLAYLLEAYRQRDAGELDFSQLITLEEEHVEYDFGTLELLGLEEGDALTVADALKAMIIVSDTPTAVAMQDVVGPARVDATLRSLGINDMTVTVFELPTTARDMALLMEAVGAGAGVTAESQQEMLALLLQETIRDGIPSGVPANSAVAHKTGNLANITHDVALIWGPGGPYVIAVLSDRSWYSEPLAAVSRAVWDYFAANP